MASSHANVLLFEPLKASNLIKHDKRHFRSERRAKLSEDIIELEKRSEYKLAFVFLVYVAVVLNTRDKSKMHLRSAMYGEVRRFLRALVTTSLD